MRRNLLVLFALTLVLTLQVKAEAFKVLHFHSDITLNLDGSFDIVEDILLEFSESKHGFLRKLPYRYTPAPNVQGEIAEGHTTGLDYFTPITDITVDDREFSVTKNYSDYEIKIGSADEYVTGRQRYRIHYKVYGAINFFSKSSEFYWNVNGNDWEVDFDSIDATVHFPTNKIVDKSDLQVFTGAVGSVLGAATAAPSAGRVDFLCTRKLLPHEGMTIVVRLPKGYLHHDPVPLRVRADVYMIDSLRMDAAQNEDGSIDVDALFYLDVLRAAVSFDLVLGAGYDVMGPKGIVRLPVEYEILESKVRQLKYDFTAFATLGEADAGRMSRPLTVTGTSFPKAGKYLLHLRYRVWGAVTTDGDGVACHLPLFQPAADAPLAAAHVRFHWKAPQPVDLKNLKVSFATPKTSQFTLSPEALQMDAADVFNPGERIDFSLKLPTKRIALTSIPKRVYSPDHYIQSYHVDLDVQPDGSLHIAHKMVVYQSSWYSPQERPLMMAYSKWTTYEFIPAKPQFWGVKGEYLVDHLEYQGELVNYGQHRDHRLRLTRPNGSTDPGIDTLIYSYHIAGVLHDSAGRKWLNYPLIEQLDVPADLVTATIRYPGGTLTNQDFSVAICSTFNYDYVIQDHSHLPEVAYKDGEVNLIYAAGMREGQLLLLQMRLPKGSVHGSLWLTTRLLWANHRALFFPLFLILPLFLLWFFKGRDKRFTTVVEFYPPDDLTPAEAGMLIDDKLHNRDLLALIYYWGAQGLIAITELYDNDGKVTDYQFEKIKKLPASARKYEKTIFDKLFALGDKTNVSGHNQTFATTMSTARQQLADYVKNKNFYRPGTQGWVTAMKIVGWLFVLIALIGAGVVLFELSTWFRGRWEIPFGWGGCAALLFFFARIMPKKAGFGQKQYEKLVGFKEFVERAEQAKLEELVHTNPDYFGMTLPYAIALGIATKWVDRFGPLLIAPPTYYHTNTVADLDALRRMEFAHVMQRQLDAMARNLNSTPPSSGGGSSSYASGSSGSSYSSSSSSGGSSYSSGGGYSGGGYGGGGGSSW
jgi:uncharacterized membrane protein